MKINLTSIKLTQEQVHCKNKIVDLAVTYLVAKNDFLKKQNTEITVDELKQLNISLQKLIDDADELYGKWFTDRCMEIARTLTGIE